MTPAEARVSGQLVQPTLHCARCPAMFRAVGHLYWHTVEMHPGVLKAEPVKEHVA